MRFSRRLPRVAIAAASLLFLALAQSAFGQRALTVADLYDPGRRINFSGGVPGGLTWLDDRHYVERQAGGPPMRVEAMTGERAPLVDPARLEAAIAALPDVDAGEAGRAARRTAMSSTATTRGWSSSSRTTSTTTTSRRNASTGSRSRPPPRPRSPSAPTDASSRSCAKGTWSSPTPEAFASTNSRTTAAGASATASVHGVCYSALVRGRTATDWNGRCRHSGSVRAHAPEHDHAFRAAPTGQASSRDRAFAPAGERFDAETAGSTGWQYRPRRRKLLIPNARP